MKKITAAEHLTDNEYKVLMQVYANHSRSMGMKERVKYSISDIKKVERNYEGKCLNVHYTNGDWFHYLPNGTWY